MSDAWESAEEQLDKLMQELRVALPGVQVLLAFLLTALFDSLRAECPTVASSRSVGSLSILVRGSGQ
jgi:hypothetical protein